MGAVNATGIEDYRLAGTIQLSADAHLAIVEVADAQQQLLRVGDQIAGGTVVLIRDEEAHIRIGSETLVIKLEGAGYASASEAVPGFVVASLDIDSSDVSAIAELTGDDNKVLSEQLADSLSLPNDLLVNRIQVGGRMFESLQVALPEMRRALSRGEFAHLFFEAGGSIDEVYLMPKTGTR